VIWRFAERFDFRGELHFEPVVGAERKDAGEGQAASPAGGDEFGIGAAFGDPAPEDAVAFGVELGFFGVVDAVVENAALLRMEDEFLRIEFANFPDDLASGGIKQNVFFAEREKVRALPHFTGVDGIGVFFFGPVTGSEWMEIFPVVQISGAIEQNAATDFELAGGDAKKPKF